jgi:tetratricopeptide (TPR) repeat protein
VQNTVVDLAWSENPLEQAYDLLEAGQPEEAETRCRAALEQNPANPDALNFLGVLLLDQKRTEEAIACAAAAIGHSPLDVRFHNSLGNALQQAGRCEEALLCYQQALQLDPDSAPLHGNIANALAALDRFSDAVGHYLAAIARDPYNYQFHTNLAHVLRRQGMQMEAAGVYKEALRLNPSYEAARRGYVSVIGELGEAFYRNAQFADARNCFAEAVSWEPNAGEMHVSLGHSLAMLGDLAAAWPELEWRWRLKDSPAILFQQPQWDGTALDGRTILVWAEQGAGDTIQYLRYADVLRESYGARVVLECQPWLASLAGSNRAISQVIPFGDPLIDFDVQAPLQSLPWILKTARETMPASIPYLTADPDDVSRWRTRIDQTLAGRPAAKKIGLVWAGSPLNPADVQRSMPFEYLLPLAERGDVAWFSLQKGAAAYEAGHYTSFPLHSLPEAVQDFAHTAAVMMNLDLVITVDTSAAHLAGALGVPVWNLLAHVADSRWMAAGKSTPWYPTMRLFRQSAPGDWTGVVSEVAAALRAF